MNDKEFEDKLTQIFTKYFIASFEVGDEMQSITEKLGISDKEFEKKGNKIVRNLYFKMWKERLEKQKEVRFVKYT